MFTRSLHIFFRYSINYQKLLLHLLLEEPEPAGVDDEMPIIDTVAGDVSMDDIQVPVCLILPILGYVSSHTLISFDIN